MKHPKYTFCQ